VPEKGATSRQGGIVAIQSFGDFLQFHPHLHVLCSDGCFYGDGMFRVAPRIDTKPLAEIFPAKDGIFDRHEVFKMLLSKGKITQDLVNMLMSWPPARRAYASESATRVSMSSVDQGSSPERKRPWPPARRAYASERKPGPVYHTRRKRLRCASGPHSPRSG
jgi:hypothetical protein